MVVYDHAIETPCKIDLGNAAYCWKDRTIYIDPQFLAVMSRQVSLQLHQKLAGDDDDYLIDGNLAATTIVAHELGHALQDAYGLNSNAITHLNRSYPLDVGQMNGENRADCVAGAFAFYMSSVRMESKEVQWTKNTKPLKMTRPSVGIDFWINAEQAMGVSGEKPHYIRKPADKYDIGRSLGRLFEVDKDGHLRHDKDGHLLGNPDVLYDIYRSHSIGPARLEFFKRGINTFGKKEDPWITGKWDDELPFIHKRYVGPEGLPDRRSIGSWNSDAILSGKQTPFGLGPSYCLDAREDDETTPE